MDRKRKQQIVLAVVLVLVAVTALLLRPRTQAVEPNDADYYTGPRRSKSNPNVWVTADGKIVPPPPDANQQPATAPPSKLAGE